MISTKSINQPLKHLHVIAISILDLSSLWHFYEKIKRCYKLLRWGVLPIRFSQPTFPYYFFAVRLSRGDHSHGVVQIMEESWAVLCGEGFTNKEAKVVCRQLGFQDGMSLALGSFGTFYGRYVRPNITCNGTEKSILDCKYDEFRGCQKDSFLGYAVVSCFNGKPSKGMYLVYYS